MMAIPDYLCKYLCPASIKVLWPKFIQSASCALNLSEKTNLREMRISNKLPSAVDNNVFKKVSSKVRKLLHISIIAMIAI